MPAFIICIKTGNHDCFVYFWAMPMFTVFLRAENIFQDSPTEIFIEPIR